MQGTERGDGGSAGWITASPEEALEKIRQGYSVRIATEGADYLFEALMRLDPELRVSLAGYGETTVITGLSDDEAQQYLEAGVPIRCSTDMEKINAWADILRSGRGIRLPAHYAEAMCEKLVRHHPDLMVAAFRTGEDAVIRTTSREEMEEFGDRAGPVGAGPDMQGRMAN
ncbi:hypothetical protein IBTHAUMO2_650003 [Nitrosopumilaceae archaeon]|nr:hypothetical protein IBTHAUMO2_650003 [Nitrosopumilaceae archaeon]